MIAETLGVLQRAWLFEALPPGDMATFLDDPATIDLGPAEKLFSQGDAALTLFVVLSGAVELAVERPGHPPEVLSRLGPGETAGADSLTPGSRHTATARAVDKTTLAVINAPRLLAYLDDHFDLALGMIASMAGNLRGQVKEITELKLQSTTERLASYLAELAGSANGRAVVRLPFEKRLLADRLGMEPATLSRAFGKLREYGVETGRGDKVVIGDVGQLRRLAEAVEMVMGDMS